MSSLTPASSPVSDPSVVPPAPGTGGTTTSPAPVLSSTGSPPSPAPSPAASPAVSAMSTPVPSAASVTPAAPAISCLGDFSKLFRDIVPHQASATDDEVKETFMSRWRPSTGYKRGALGREGGLEKAARSWGFLPKTLEVNQFRLSNQEKQDLASKEKNHLDLVFVDEYSGVTDRVREGEIEGGAPTKGLLNKFSYKAASVMERSPVFWQMCLAVNNTNKSNRDNRIMVTYRDDNLSVSSPLCGTNGLMTLKTLQVMARLMDQTGNKNLKFDLQDFLNAQSSQHTKDLFKQVFEEDKTLQARLSRADRALLGLPEATAASQSSPPSSPSSKATFTTAMGSGSPPVVSSHASLPLSSHAQDLEYLTDAEISGISQKMWSDHKFTEVAEEGTPIAYQKNDGSMVLAKTLPIGNFFQQLANDEALGFHFGRSVVGIVQVNQDHYCAVRVNCDVFGAVSAKVVESMGNDKGDSSQASVQSHLTGLVNGLNERFTSRSFTPGLATSEIGLRQADGFTCGVYALSSAEKLMDIEESSQQLRKLKDFASGVDPQSVKDSAYECLERFRSQLTEVNDSEPADSKRTQALLEIWKGKLNISEQFAQNAAL
jgi:hypothetical protein